MGTSVSSPSSPPCKRQFACGKCSRTFSTQSHLNRHAKMHAGERNHKCPFPGCETRCTRRDNLQQHYRIHLQVPCGSRKPSGAATRAAMSKQADLNARCTKRSKTPLPPLISTVPVAADSLDSPVARLDPPNTPPPLVEAYASQPFRSTSSQSSARSTPTAAHACVQPCHRALHPLSRASHSPASDTTYSHNQQPPSGGSSYWNYHRYYGDLEKQYEYPDTPAPSSVLASPNAQYASSQSLYAASSKPHSALGRSSQCGMGQSTASLGDLTPSTVAHPLAHYVQSYTQGVPFSSSLIYPSSAGNARSYTLAGYPAGSRGTHGEGPSPPYAAAQLAYPTPPLYYLQQQRYPSPPTMMASIQTEKLARGGEQLSVLSSTTSASAVQCPSVRGHSNHALGPASHLAQRSNSVPRLEAVHHSRPRRQQQASSQHASYDPYPDPNMSRHSGNAGCTPILLRRSSTQTSEWSFRSSCSS